ncbi:uncharacterized protein DUF1573 [Chitinophaga skermanii]|uniref:Uncharacterized protein DUF1573 n=1 Tax=Chitinophaga skermanii TaxID=331697 RepID=A0A327QKI0_9BACT|nr:DUF1573 domain-containing protein [Chitinophaga skermanii]RAJ02267.1 uncharacterized protein DUF1573 [Chitinophaga skermanii]
MKTFFYTLACCVMLAACQSNTKSTPATEGTAATADTAKGFPTMTFENPEHDFGNITPGQVVEYNFKFANNGTKDLIIEDVVTSCGCTVPEWPKRPIKPGETEYLKVRFDSKGKAGYQEKDITIKANTEEPLFQGAKITATIVAEN